ncbi:MAG: hypothetical protein EAZ30_01190 [Betaproteobacteria bacterium]|nr:MAG: hypothetical protein EAZ30_01190 [Betaproteobacteria bacterium]
MTAEAPEPAAVAAISRVIVGASIRGAVIESAARLLLVAAATDVVALIVTALGCCLTEAITASAAPAANVVGLADNRVVCAMSSVCASRCVAKRRSASSTSDNGKPLAAANSSGVDAVASADKSLR